MLLFAFCPPAVRCLPAKDGHLPAWLLNSLKMGTALSEFGCRTSHWSWACSHRVSKYHCEGRLFFLSARSVVRAVQECWLGREETSKLVGEWFCQTVETSFWLIRRQKKMSKPDTCHNATDFRGHPCYVYCAEMMTCT